MEQKSMSKVMMLVLLFTVFVTTIGGFLVFSQYSDEIQEKINGDVAEEEMIEEENQEQVEDVTVMLVNTDGTQSIYGVPYMEDQSAYDVLYQVDEENDSLTIVFDSFEFDGQTSYFIASVNEYTPDTAEEFWKFVVNGQDSSVGISDYKVEKGDVLELQLDQVTL